MSNPRQARTRLLVFTLFGDYIFPREGWAWTRSLIQILERLGVSSQAARSTLSRLSRQGWIKAERRGRHSVYALTAQGRHLLEEGTHRIFEPRTKKWDGKWRVVVYSLPEKKRNLREALRRRLSFLGFGPLAPGTWLSPHDRQADLEKLLDDLKARPYVQYFEAQWRSQHTPQELVARCWDLHSLNRKYAAFLQKWSPKLTNGKRRSNGRNSLSPSDSFTRRFWIIHEYSAFLMRDPNLPAELLPRHWWGSEAARVFREYRRLLTEAANAYIEETLSGRF